MEKSEKNPNEISKEHLDILTNYLKKVKYPGILEQLKLEIQEDGLGKFIYIILIKIDKKSRRKGIGTSVIKEITRTADIFNCRVKLWATHIYGSDIEGLIKFYTKNKFRLVKQADNEMEYKPKKKS